MALSLSGCARAVQMRGPGTLLPRRARGWTGGGAESPFLPLRQLRVLYPRQPPALAPDVAADEAHSSTPLTKY